MTVKELVKKLESVDQNKKIIVSAPSRNIFAKVDVEENNAIYYKEVVLYLLY